MYKEKLYGPKYVWFLIGWYADDWYKQPDKSVNCTAEQLKEALEGHFTTEGLMLNQDNAPTVSGLVSDDHAVSLCTIQLSLKWSQFG